MFTQDILLMVNIRETEGTQVKRFQLINKKSEIYFIGFCFLLNDGQGFKAVDTAALR